MNERLVQYIEESFLKPLLEDKNITDISYNGVSIFYVHNINGRQKSDIEITNREATDFIRQIANFAEKQFSYVNPILDISVSKYRINAVHPSIVRVQNDKSCSFAIRIASDQPRISGDDFFMDKKCFDYLMNSLNNGESLVIAGSTGSGKTELQKFLLSKLPENSRVIVIDNIQELEYLRNYDYLDITSWQASSSNESCSIQELIRNALRSNPDWLVVAEARGKEMNEVLNSVMTGHPIVTTLHAKSLEAIPKRISRMVLSADTTQKHEDIMADINEHLKTYVFLKRKYSNFGKVIRYIDSIGELQLDGTMKVVFRKEAK